MENKHKKNSGYPKKGEPFGLRVIVEDGNLEKALRKFKRKVSNSGVLQEYRARQEFVPNTEKRLKAEAAAKKRHDKRMRMDPFYENQGPQKGKKRK